MGARQAKNAPLGPNWPTYSGRPKVVQKSSIQTTPSNSVLGTPCLRPHVTKVSTVPKEHEDQSPMYTAVKPPSRSLWSPKKRSLDCDPPVRVDCVWLFLI